MAKKRVHEIAKEQGLPSRDVLTALNRAGIEAKFAVAMVDEDEALQALGNGGTAIKVVEDHGGRSTNGGPSEPRAYRDQLPHRGGGARRHAPANGQAPRRSHRPVAPWYASPAGRPTNGRHPTRRAQPDRRPNWFQRARLRMRLQKLRQRRDGLALDVGGLTFDMYRFRARRDHLVRQKLQALLADNEEIERLEQLLEEEEPDRGSACPNCGLFSAHARFCMACGHALPPPPEQATRISAPVAAAAITLLAAAWLLGGIGRDGGSLPLRSSGEQPQLSTASLARQGKSLIANAQGRSIPVYRSAGSSRPFKRLSNPNEEGYPRVFMVTGVKGSRVRVQLPDRPNGSTGWVSASRVLLTTTSYSVTVKLRSFQLVVRNGNKTVARERIGVGASVTPTPTGRYYVTELLKQPDPTGLYGPFAFGLSVHSDVVTDFAGGDGQIGIHGTNEPHRIGTNVSRGCIRLYNSSIARLARILPAGTPVRIERT